jgi:hypothetical protein
MCFRLSIPIHNPADRLHRKLADLALQSELVASDAALPATRFEMQRQAIRRALAQNGVAVEIDATVKALLA